jgi:AraC-like DNA-binding protein
MTNALIIRKTQRRFKALSTIKISFYTIMSFFLSVHVYAQHNDLKLKAEELVFSNPDEAIKIADHILNISQKLEESAMANLLLAKSHLVKGDYVKALIYAFDDINQLDDISLETRIENHILKATLLRKLYLDNQSVEYLNKAKVLSSQLSDNKDFFEYHIFLERTDMLLDRLKTNEAIAYIIKAELQFNDFFNKNLDEKRTYYLAKERAFNSLSKYDSAYVYINKTLDLIDVNRRNNLYEKAIIYKESGLLCLQKKELEKSKEMFFIALRFAEILDNPFLLEQINRDLAISFLASNQKSQHKVYYEEFLILNNNVEKIELEAVNTFYNIISTNEENQIQNENKKYTNYLYIAIASSIFIIGLGLLILLKSENKKRRKREIINYLDVSRNNFTKVKPSIKQTTKRLSIPEETEQNLLLKLKRFEKSNKFLNKDMSLAVLAGQFETNTKYLSGVINKHYDDNFNTFINKLRINYIIEKLKTDPNYINYKISFLAEETGYSSHSNFATIFKAIVGMPPATFINLLQTERDEIKMNKESS